MINKRHARFTEILGAARLRKTSDKHYHHADWKVGAESDVAPTSMLYGVVRTGYSPGTYPAVPDSSRQTPTIAPSNLRSYTAVLKNRFLDRKLTLNVEGFYYDYKDLLVTNNNPVTRVNEFFNAKKIEIYGTQIDAGLALGSMTEAHAVVSYLHARNKDFTVPSAIAGAAPLDYSGLATVFSLKWSINLGASHSLAFANSGKLTFRADSHFESSSWGAFEHRPSEHDFFGDRRAGTRERPRLPTIRRASGAGGISDVRVPRRGGRRP